MQVVAVILKIIGLLFSSIGIIGDERLKSWESWLRKAIRIYFGYKSMKKIINRSKRWLKYLIPSLETGMIIAWVILNIGFIIFIFKRGRLLLYSLEPWARDTIIWFYVIWIFSASVPLALFYVGLILFSLFSLLKKIFKFKSNDKPNIPRTKVAKYERILLKAKQIIWINKIFNALKKDGYFLIISLPYIPIFVLSLIIIAVATLASFLAIFFLDIVLISFVFIIRIALLPYQALDKLALGLKLKSVLLLFGFLLTLTGFVIDVLLKI